MCPSCPPIFDKSYGRGRSAVPSFGGRGRCFLTHLDFWLDRLDRLDRYSKIRDFLRPTLHSEPGRAGPPPSHRSGPSLGSFGLPSLDAGRPRKPLDLSVARFEPSRDVLTFRSPQLRFQVWPAGGVDSRTNKNAPAEPLSYYRAIVGASLTERTSKSKVKFANTGGRSSVQR